MAEGFSIYLDIVRFTAAFLVFLDHACGQRISGGLFYQFAGFGPEAVVIFFVLSGYVIAYVTTSKETTATVYTIARASRMYSVVVPALILTFFFDYIGRSTKIDLYSSAYHYPTDGMGWQFISAVLFIHQIWNVDSVPGSNWSFWTLGYEVWYYVIFGLFMFTSQSLRLLCILLAILFCGPTITAMFPLWLLGVACQRLNARTKVSLLAAFILLSGSIIVWAGYEWWSARYGRLTYATGDLITRSQLPQDYLIATLFALHLIGFNGLTHMFQPMLKTVVGPVRWLAGNTFTLYLMHEPLLRMLASVTPWPTTDWRSRILVLGGTLLAVAVIAYGTERRKQEWRRAFEYLFHLTTGTPPARRPAG